MSIKKTIKEAKRKRSKPYYRIIEDNGEISVVEMQDFDEYDYNQDRFLTDKKFVSEEKALKWINEKYE